MRLLLFPLFLGCYVQGHHKDMPHHVGGGYACTEEARSSVTVWVVDAAGEPILDATGTYAVGKGAETACEAWGDGSLVCGYEVAGNFTITVSAAGYASASEEVFVADGRCHVVSSELVVVLEPESTDCTDDIRPSVTGTASSATGEALVNPFVTWAPVGEEGAPCTLVAGVFSCGEEVAGILEINAYADGHSPVVDLVEVEMSSDGCHVVTEEITLLLQAD